MNRNLPYQWTMSNGRYLSTRWSSVVGGSQQLHIAAHNPCLQIMVYFFPPSSPIMVVLRRRRWVGWVCRGVVNDCSRRRETRAEKTHTKKKKEKRKEEIVNFLVLIKFVCGLEATVFVRLVSTLWCLGRFCSSLNPTERVVLWADFRFGIIY